jgi:predicted O-methyltransferase YrrM
MNNLFILVAWDLSSKILGLRDPHTPPEEDYASVRAIQEYVSFRGREWRQADPSGMEWFKGPLLYFLVRRLPAAHLVETGVASGVSTSFILQAIKENGAGSLISLDLPNADPLAQIPPKANPGWIVPDELRRNWILRLGDARQVLPNVVQELPELDVFLHDSLHTYDHMLWEYGVAWAHLRPGGLLLSDDVGFNSAFADFCHDHGKRAHVAYGFGASRK